MLVVGDTAYRDGWGEWRKVVGEKARNVSEALAIRRHKRARLAHMTTSEIAKANAEELRAALEYGRMQLRLNPLDAWRLELMEALSVSDVRLAYEGDAERMLLFAEGVGLVEIPDEAIEQLFEQETPARAAAHMIASVVFDPGLRWWE